MNNSILEDFTLKHKNLFSSVKRIDINAIYDMDVTLLLMDDNGGIGGQFTVFGDYIDDNGERKTANYNVSDFVCLLNYCASELGCSITLNDYGSKYFSIKRKGGG